jgi:hypothetical protein
VGKNYRKEDKREEMYCFEVLDALLAVQFYNFGIKSLDPDPH